jgi:hypothetical protein
MNLHRGARAQAISSARPGQVGPCRCTAGARGAARPPGGSPHDESDGGFRITGVSRRRPAHRSWSRTDGGGGADEFRLPPPPCRYLILTWPELALAATLPETDGGIQDPPQPLVGLGLGRGEGEWSQVNSKETKERSVGLDLGCVGTYSSFLALFGPKLVAASSAYMDPAYMKCHLVWAQKRTLFYPFFLKEPRAPMRMRSYSLTTLNQTECACPVQPCIGY